MGSLPTFLAKCEGEGGSEEAGIVYLKGGRGTETQVADCDGENQVNLSSDIKNSRRLDKSHQEVAKGEACLLRATSFGTYYVYNKVIICLNKIFLKKFQQNLNKYKNLIK